MQLQYLYYFVEIARQKSISKASQLLYVSQPTLSMAIHALEKELNITVFIRSNKGVSLTTEGQQLYKYATEVLNQVSRMEQISADRPRKVLTVASCQNIVALSSVIAQYYEALTEESAAIELLELRIDSVVKKVADREADIGFLMINQTQIRELKQELRHKKLAYHSLGTDGWVAYVGPKNPNYNCEIVNIRSLMPFPVVRQNDDFYSTLTTKNLIIDGISLSELNQKVIYMNSSSFIINFIKRTTAYRLGVTLVQMESEEMGLHAIPIRNCDVSVDVGWISREGEALSADAEMFIELLTREIQQRLASYKLSAQ